MASGGYHPPTNPAPASGEGAFSRRTDGRVDDIMAKGYIPSPGYGEGAALNAAAQAGNAAIAQGQPGQPSQADLLAQMGGSMPVQNRPSFNRGTERPDEDIMAGVDGGYGPGSEALIPNAAIDQQADQSTLTAMLGLMTQAARDGSPTNATNNIIRLLRGEV